MTTLVTAAEETTVYSQRCVSKFCQGIDRGGKSRILVIGRVGANFSRVSTGFLSTQMRSVAETAPFS